MNSIQLPIDMCSLWIRVLSTCLDELYNLSLVRTTWELWPMMWPDLVQDAWRDPLASMVSLCGVQKLQEAVSIKRKPYSQATGSGCLFQMMWSSRVLHLRCFLVFLWIYIKFFYRNWGIKESSLSFYFTVGLLLLWEKLLWANNHIMLHYGVLRCNLYMSIVKSLSMSFSSITQLIDLKYSGILSKTLHLQSWWNWQELKHYNSIIPCIFWGSSQIWSLSPKVGEFWMVMQQYNVLPQLSPCKQVNLPSIHHWHYIYIYIERVNRLKGPSPDELVLST